MPLTLCISLHGGWYQSSSSDELPGFVSRIKWIGCNLSEAVACCWEDHQNHFSYSSRGLLPFPLLSPAPDIISIDLLCTTWTSHQHNTCTLHPPLLRTCLPLLINLSLHDTSLPPSSSHYQNVLLSQNKCIKQADTVKVQQPRFKT